MKLSVVRLSLPRTRSRGSPELVRPLYSFIALYLYSLICRGKLKAMGEFNRVGSRTFVYWLVTRILVALFVAALIGVGLYLLSFTAGVSSLPVALSVTAASAVALATLIFLILAAATLLITVIQYGNWGYHIDEHALFLRRGLLAVDTETIPFFKVVNTSFDQSAWQRIFGVGNLIIEQDDDESVWSSIDKSTASQVIEMVSTKGNIQPIAVSSGQFPQPPTK